MSFLSKISKIVNSHQSRSIIITGNIYDLFFDGTNYVPLIDYLKSKIKLDPTPTQKGITQVIYQVNRPINVPDEGRIQALESSWLTLHPNDDSLSKRFFNTIDNSAYALELMKQMAQSNRHSSKNPNNLLFILEAADMLLPECEINRMMPIDRKRVSIVQDWFQDPEFLNGHDTVLLFAESRSSIHHRISRLPNVLNVDIPLPDLEVRKHFIEFFSKQRNITVSVDNFAEQTAGLSLHAIRQLMCSSEINQEELANKVEAYMTSQLGEGVIEFKRPKHKLVDVIGFSKLKKFLNEELIPGLKATGKDALSGAAVSGPIGGGKTFLCEAVAAELDCPVIVLKNIRSKWYGETDQIFEKLRRLLESFHKIVIFVDEADTMFGDIQSDQETERRLTGKIQAMMSDTALKGKVFWFLMTARIHKLSPDIRRPGRMDLIIPVLDPTDGDKEDFIRWTFGDLIQNKIPPEIFDIIKDYSSASYSMLRSLIKSKKCSTIEEALNVAKDIMLPDIGDTRKYQTIQAILNCTRKSLIGNENIDNLKKQLKLLESQGIS